MVNVMLAFIEGSISEALDVYSPEEKEASSPKGAQPPERTVLSEIIGNPRLHYLSNLGGFHYFRNPFVSGEFER